MTTKVSKILKKILMGFFILYGYNILVPAQALIPLNIVTILVTSFFGLPGLTSLIIIRLLVY